MDIKLPNLGEGAESGTVVSIFVKPGDQIQEGQPIIELENEKAVAPIPASASGRVAKLYVKEGDKLSVGQPILALDGDGASAPAPAAKPSSAVAAVDNRGRASSAGPTTVQPRRVAPEVPSVDMIGEPVPQEGVAAAPSVRKLAQELGLDLTRVRGSQRGGRITLEDVRAYVQQLQQRAFQQPTSGAPAAPRPAESIDFAKWGPVSKKPLTALRSTIARRLGESWTSVPRVTQFDEADITALDALRKKYAKAYEAKGARLTLTSFALKAVATALKKHPIFNASLDEAAGEIVFKGYYHLGVAVDTEQGLIVPVIRNVGKKSMFELSKELAEVAAKARDRKLTADELKGGTFTISNQGGIGSGAFTPIVNKPEVAILGIGRGALKPVVREGKIEPRLMLPLGLSYDHRVIDGGSAARFMVEAVREFESFGENEVKL
ncbi:MAG TPA: 2-oxo acid dehydrogenase subunit E2 [Verrucomicrobiae bacterium]|nr:2-oxo acid dehydrogenase subunit E2 [Verrucomicrobiae bacterium]